MTKAVSLNIASRSNDPNGRGKVDLEDRTFEYIPIPEKKETIVDVPSYSDLEWLDNAKLKEKDVAVHLDPEFDTYTYGHIKRGFGDMNSLLGLNEGNYLFFHSTLVSSQNLNRWLTAIIGYFEIEETIDCREVSANEIRALSRFKNNAHIKRKEPGVDLLISGTDNSELLEKCIPLSSLESPKRLKDDFKELIRTPKGKKINDGNPWYRWTLKVLEPEKLLMKR